MPDLPRTLGQAADAVPVVLVPYIARRMENVVFQPQYGLGVATSADLGPGGRSVIEFSFETMGLPYELWIEYAAEESRPTSIALDGEEWFEATAAVTGGEYEARQVWHHEARQVWHHEATIAFAQGSHRLTVSSIAFLPHIRALALLPVSVPARGLSAPPVYRPLRPIDLPRSRGLQIDAAPIRLMPLNAVRLENIVFQPAYGLTVATSSTAPGGGRFSIEFSFETDEHAYELWIEYAAAESRSTSIAFDGEEWFEGTTHATGGACEDAQQWHYEATIAFAAGTHRLTVSRFAFLPHIRALALIPVSASAHELMPPPRHRPPRPERTLVCVIAQTRAHSVTWAGFKRNVLDELRADLAVAVGMGDKYDYANPFWQHARYRWAAPEYQDFGDGLDEAQCWLASESGVDVRPWRHILKTGGHWLGGIKGPYHQAGAAAILYYIRWFLRHQLMLSGLLERYDRFVITRSDFIWDCPHPPLSVLSPDAIWFPDGEYGGGLTDRHMVVSRAELPASLGLLDDIVLRPDALITAVEADLRTQPDPPFSIERYMKLHLRLTGLLGRARVFPYVMYTVRAEGDPTSWAQGGWDDDVGRRVKYLSEYEGARGWRERLNTRQDWETLQRDCPGLFRPPY